jgi:four helix bundle protein
MPQKITSFEQLISWQKAIEFAAEIYRATNNFPANEKFGLSSQIQRAAVSISANIAEGFGRAGKSEKLQFYSIAYGSLLESKSHLYVANKLGYLKQDRLEVLLSDCTNMQQLINAMKTAVKNYER